MLLFCVRRIPMKRVYLRANSRIYRVASRIPLAVFLGDAPVKIIHDRSRRDSSRECYLWIYRSFL